MAPAATSTSLWESAKSDIRSLFPDDVFKLWFEPITCLESTPDSLVLGVPTDFAAIWIHDNYLDLIVQRLRLTAGRAISVKLRKAESAASESPNRTSAESSQGSTRLRPVAPRRTPRSDERNAGTPGGVLNPRNTFETFVVGNNNQMAHAASLAVAQAPAQAYNPLFLYGDTGLGKTHLMHAIGHAVLRNNPEARVAYLSTEKFTNEFIQALQENALTRFRQRYRSVDVLLIDDVQFLADKERIQEEFFHTFNALHEARKQIVLTCDRPANEIQGLEQRLISRFEWGQTADLQPPDVETRLAILRAREKSLGSHLPPEITNFLATRIRTNVRRLEGAFTRVAAYAQLTGRPLTLETVESLLREILQEEGRQAVTIDFIQKRVAEHYDIRLADMTSKRRPENIAFPRQVAMYLARQLTESSLASIGDAFGGRDHGTVMHACRQVKDRMEVDANVRQAVSYLEKQLQR